VRGRDSKCVSVRVYIGVRESVRMCALHTSKCAQGPVPQTAETDTQQIPKSEHLFVPENTWIAGARVYHVSQWVGVLWRGEDLTW
jgi:hypothetical protein